MDIHVQVIAVEGDANADRPFAMAERVRDKLPVDDQLRDLCVLGQAQSRQRLAHGGAGLPDCGRLPAEAQGHARPGHGAERDSRPPGRPAGKAGPARRAPWARQPGGSWPRWPPARDRSPMTHSTSSARRRAPHTCGPPSWTRERCPGVMSTWPPSSAGCRAHSRTSPTARTAGSSAATRRGDRSGACAASRPAAR